MRFACVSPLGDALPWWLRLHDEGNDVRVWIGKPEHKTIGDGLVQKAGTLPDLLRWAREAPSIVFFDGTSMGQEADRIRASGLPTVCGGAFMDRLEKDREFGMRLAQAAGCSLPPYEEYASIAECRKAIESIDYPIYFKTDRRLHNDATHGAPDGAEMGEYLDGLMEEFGSHGTCIIQKKIDGVPLSTARWWNGQDWVGPYEGTYENKKFMNDDVGPATGCSFNVVWFYDDDEPDIAQKLRWERLTPLFRAHNAPPGLYDINAIVDGDGNAYFLEWTPRLGYDSEMTSQYLLPNLGHHVEAVALGHDVPDPSGDLAYSVRLSVPPYPSEYVKNGEKASCDGLRLAGHIDDHFVPYGIRREGKHDVMAGTEGIVGLAVAVGSPLSVLHADVMDYLKDDLRVPGVMYRTDGAKDIRKAAQTLLESGIDIPLGLTR